MTENNGSKLRAPTRRQHHAVVARQTIELTTERRPRPGPIAVLPSRTAEFEDAVREGGGIVTELSYETRGIVWLSSERSVELAVVLRENPTIEWVQLPWAGVDAFSEVIESYRDCALPLFTSAKGAYSQPVAEHALTLALALLRVIPTRVRASSWSSEPEGVSLYGRRVLIIGAGGIAIELVRLLDPFGVDIDVVRRSDAPFPWADRTVTPDRLGELLPEADVVFVAAAMTPETRNLIAAAELALMKRSTVLVNVARGGLIDTGALVSALASGQILGAGLDVTSPEPLPDGHPLWSEPRAIITPHSADTPDMTMPLLAERIRLNVEAFLGNGQFVGVVDARVGY